MAADPPDPAAIEAELRTQARHLAMIFNSARDMMLLAKVDRADLIRIVSVNRPYVEMVRAAGYRLTAQDFEGRTLTEAMQLLGFDAGTKALIRSRYEQVITTRQSLEYDEVTPTPAGVFHGRTTITPVLDESGACGFLLYSSHDMTESVRAGQALRESEEKFAKAFLACPDAISVHELESGRYVDVNAGFLRLFGGKREEIVGRTALELGLWSDPGERQDFIGRLRRDGRVRNYTTKVRVRDGRLRTCELSAERIEVGGRAHNVTVLHDITERIEAEQALRDSEEKFAAAFRVSPDLISISEHESGRYLEVNDTHAAFFGFSREEMIGRSPLELGIIADAGPRENILRLLERDGHVREIKVPARTRDGRDVVISLSAEPIQVKGRKCLLRVSRDITAALRAEQALRDSEEKFAKAFRASPFSLTISELSTGRYVDVNSGFEQLSGYTREEVIGRTSLELNLWINPAERDALVRRLREKGTVRGLELDFRAKDGRILSTLCNCEPIEVAGVPCLLNVLEDTSERRRAEEQKAALEAQLRQTQKLEALGTLAGGIAHDFNNILTAIIVNQELALMDINEPEEVRRRLAEIGQASGRAKELVRQILTFSRQQPRERLRQHLQMIIREALGLLRASLPATIEIVQELSPEAPPVLADASQIHQVVMNLCTNAAHAMRDRPGRLTVRLVPRLLDEAACLALHGLKPGRHALMSVTDTGHGMDATVLARIFEPFFTTKDPGEGTGLGLPMVHGIMRDHEGAIFVQSAPGKGATFDLYFPEAAEAGDPARTTEPGIMPGQGESVLVVDDEEAICGAIGTMLQRIGYRVQTFSDPRAALGQFRANPSAFDLLLTDRTMPHLSGPELIAQIHAVWPGLPVLLMSGMTGSVPQDDAAEKGGYSLVEKPVDIADLSRAARRALHPAPTS